MTPDQKAALDALDWLLIALNMSHTEWCDEAAWKDDFKEKIEIIRAFITTPAANTGDEPCCEVHINETVWHDRYHDVCEQCWKTLGITEYTGKSIPEHIAELKAALQRPEPSAGDNREIRRLLGYALKVGKRFDDGYIECFLKEEHIVIARAALQRPEPSEGLRDFLWQTLKHCPERGATVDKIQNYIEGKREC